MKYFYSLIFIIFLSACNDDQATDINDCNRSDLICTEEFRAVTLEIRDQMGQPVELDSFYTFIDSRTIINIEKEIPNSPEIYPVINDSHMELVDFEGTVLVFVGEIGNDNVVEHQMLVGKDCCHIELLEGDQEITVDL